MDTPNDLQTNADLLMIEIGNSHISVAASINERICAHERFGLNQGDLVLEYARRAWAAFPEDKAKSIAAATVVPKVLADLREPLVGALDSPLFEVGRELHRPLSLAVESPERVGVDRICSAAAAYEAIHRACVVAGFGTAITIDCVNEEGVFMGGAILPGLNLQAKSLHEGTAALPLVTVERTGAVFGASTEQALCNGILYGVVGALREIVERYATELNAWPQLIVTGGQSELVQSECDFIDSIVPDLCLRGIALAYRKHFSAFDD